MAITIDIPAYRQAEEAAARVRESHSLEEYLAAREMMLEALDAALRGEAEFWGW